MPRLQAANRAFTTLDGAINSTTTTVSVVDASVFTDQMGPPFRVVLHGASVMEVMEVTAVSVNDLTVIRNVEPDKGSTAQSWSNGDEVLAQFTAGMFDAIPGPRWSILASGNYELPGWYVGNTSTINQWSANRMHLYPIWVSEERSYDGIAVSVSTGGSFTIRLGLYEDDEGVPGALLVDAGTVDPSTTGIKVASITETLQPGWYWTALVTDAGFGGIVLDSATASTVAPPIDGHDTNLIAGMTGLGGRSDADASYTSTALPDPAPAMTVALNAAFLTTWLRRT